jgi:hypothetical protein
MSEKIGFVLGCGRSGTHWLGHILERFPDIRITIEKNPQFQLVQSIVTNLGLAQERFPLLLQVYKQELQVSGETYYIDKSHPNLFLAKPLAEAFPDAKFMGIQRSALGTISSMLNHQGVLLWHKKWKRFPLPNYFLGISEELAPLYDQLSLVQQCALRWVAHKRHMDYLDKELGDRMLVISYEDMQQNFDKNIQMLEKFLGVSAPDDLPRPKAASLDKWKDVLSDKDVKDIAAIVGEDVATLVGA